MRIGYLSTDRGVPVFGTKGCSIHVQEIVRSFRRLGHQVELFATRVGGPPPRDLGDVPLHDLPILEPGRSAKTLDAANRAIVATLIGGRQLDLVYERHALWSYAGMTAARALNVPGILEVNAPLIEEANRFRDAVPKGPAEAAAARAFQSAYAVVAVSAGVAGYVRALSTSARVAIIPNGVDPARFGAPNRAADRFTVGFIGTMKPWHGLEVLADAFVALARRIPAARLMMVGDGPERSAVAARFEREGVGSRVEWLGSVPPDEVPGLLARMDVGVAPYPDAESCYFSPLKVFEYLAASVPVVASRAGQIAEVLVDGRHAILVAPGDAHQLTEALVRLADSPALATRLAVAGHRLVTAEFTWDRVADRILKLPGLEQRHPRLSPAAF